MSIETPASTEETLQALRNKVEEYERWFRFLDSQNRILERERQKLSAVLNFADAGFVVLDSSLSVVWANKTFTEKFFRGSNHWAVIGAKCNRVLCGRESICSTCPAAQPFQTSRAAHQEISIEIEGKPRDVYATAMPIKSPYGDTEETIVMLQDVSELKILRQSRKEVDAGEVHLRAQEEGLRQGRTMEAHGTPPAAGITGDFDGLVNDILEQTRAIKRLCPPDKDVLAAAEAIERNAHKTAELIAAVLRNGSSSPR